MTIIDEFEKLLINSKKLLPYKKFEIEIYAGNSNMIYGVIFKILDSKLINKKYEKLHLKSINKNTLLLETSLSNHDELITFASLIEFILFRINTNLNINARLIKKYVDEWLLFSNGKGKQIDLSKQVGLIGELLFLNDIQSEVFDVDYLNNWSGPDGSSVDFIFNEFYGVEIKTRTEPFKNKVTISSIEQLDNDLISQHLVVYDLISSEGGLTLKDYCNETIKIYKDIDDQNIFLNKLESVGYNHFENYTNLKKFKFFQKKIYDSKKQEFPKLLKNIDDRISNVKYKINIANIEDLPFNEVLNYARGIFN